MTTRHRSDPLSGTPQLLLVRRGFWSEGGTSLTRDSPPCVLSRDLRPRVLGQIEMGIKSLDVKGQPL